MAGGNLRFLQGKHISLVLMSTLFALFYIIPLTLLLLFAPVLQRAHNHRVVRLVQGLKPLLDTFQGPYKDRFHWWSGLMLVIRIILFIALTANTKHDLRLSALFVGVTALPLALLSAAGVYKNKLLNLHETTLNSNIIIFVLWSFFNYTVHCCQSKSVSSPSNSFERGNKSPCVANQKSILSLESPSKSYPCVCEMIRICRQNEMCRRNESRRTEMYRQSEKNPLHPPVVPPLRGNHQP